MKTVCYTALAGNYDALRDPAYISKDWDYVCFTDQPLKRHKVWEIRPLQKIIKGDAVRTNRWHKMHPHLLFPEYDRSIYIDSNIQITGPHLESRLKEFAEGSALIALPPHPERRCVYDEINVCLQTERDSDERIRDVEHLLRSEKFPPHYGLFANGLIFRRHNHPEIVDLDTAWWNMVVRYSCRDQLSLMYLLWKHRIDPRLIFPIGGNIMDYPGYHYTPHTHLLPEKEPSRRRLARLVTIFIPVKQWRHAVRNVLKETLY